MVKLLGKKVAGGVDYADLVGAGIVKYFAERALTGVIGNSTLKSGAMKLGAGFAVRKFVGRGILGDSVSLGLSIDGVEDIITSFMGSGGASREEEW